MDDSDRPAGRRSRLEDEVLEILQKSDRPPTVTERARGTIRTTRNSARVGGRRWIQTGLLYFESGIWLMALVVLGFAAYVLRDTSRLAARILVVICLGLLAYAIFQSFHHPSRGPLKQWRGRDIDLSPGSRPLWMDRLMRGPRKPPRR